MTADRDALAELAGAELRELLQILRGTDIEELELEVGGTKLYVKRSAADVAAEQHDSQALTAASTDGAASITAERVGFFHFSSDPARRAIQAGDEVATGQVLGYIDSLNVPIPVHAVSPGRVESVLVEDGQPVEYGQLLFVVRP